MEHVVIK